MRTLIIEDEAPAARRLLRLLGEVAPEAEPLATLDSIEGAVQWLKGNPAPDLLLCDVHLADGDSFEIFRQVEVSAPVVFTTAYDEYALRAFEVNSIDYLLKPIDADKLARSLDKYRKLSGKGLNADLQANLQALLRGFQKTEYKSRFLVRYADRLMTVEGEQIAYFSKNDRTVYLVTADGQAYPLDYTLDEVEKAVDPARFFRLNRQFVAALPAIDAVHAHFNGKLLVNLAPDAKEEVFVSRERAGKFKEWLDGTWPKA